MGTPEQESSSDQDWRLAVEPDAPDAGGALHGLIARLRGPDLVKEIEAAVSHDVVITHDGKLLFAYAADEATLIAARTAIERTLQQDGINASVRVSHWDDERDEWRQTDPPLSAGEQQREDVAEREADAIETRTMVASSGMLDPRGIRAEHARLGQQARVGVQDDRASAPDDDPGWLHGHRPEAQDRRVLREVSAPRSWAFMRTETSVMMSPL